MLESSKKLELLKKHHLFNLIGMALFILFAFTLPGSAQSDPPVIVNIIPDDAQVVVNQTIDIAVQVQDVEDLYGIDILMEYDATALEVLDMDSTLPGVQVMLGTLLDPGFVIVNLADNDMGRLRMAMTQLNPSTPKSGTGTLIVVRFKGKALAQDTDVTVLEAKLASPFGSLIEVDEIQNGLLSVVESIVGPTNTSIPGQPPGTPMPTATNTLVPTITPTFTATPIPTDTPVPTATPLASMTFTATVEQAATDAPTAAQPSPTSTQAKATEVSTGLETEISPTPNQDLAAISEPESTYTEVQSSTGVQNDPGVKAVLEKQKEKINPLWFIIPGVVIAGGAVFYFLTRKKDYDEY